MGGVAALALALAGGAVFGLHRIGDPDLFQQIAVGRAILADPGSIGRSSFHYTWPDYPYVADKWLASVLAAIVDRLGGERGLVVFQAIVPALVAAAWWFLFRAWGARRATSLVAVALALVACGFRLEPRPGSLGLILLSVLLALLRSEMPCTRVCWLIPLVFLLWVNLHGYFVVGLLALAAAGIAVALGDPANPFASGVGRAAAVRRAGMVLAAATLACCVHPQGASALAWPFRQLVLLKEHGYLREAVLEFRPTTILFRELGIWRWVALVATLATAFGVQRLGGVRGRGARTGLALLAVLPWLVFPPRGLQLWPYRLTFALWLAATFEVAAAIRARRWLGPLLWGEATALALPLIRNLTLIPPVALVLLAPTWTRVLEAPARSRRRWVAWSVALACLGAATWARLADHLPPGSYRSPGWTGLGIDRATLPVEAADFIERERLDGKLLNHFDNGGYLLYRFHPGRRTFIAGNTSMYPPEFFRTFHREIIGPDADPERIARLYGVRVAVLDHASPETALLTGKLVDSPPWRLVHLDEAAAVYVFRDEGTASPASPIEIDLDRRSAELVRGLHARPVLPAWLAPRRHIDPEANLGRFLRSAGRPDLAMEVFGRLWSSGPDVGLAILMAETAEQANALPQVIPRLESVAELEDAGAVRSWLARALYVRAVRDMAARETTDSVAADLTRATRLAPNEPGPPLALARLAAGRGDLGEARRWLRSALELATDDSIRDAAAADPILAPLLAAE